MTIQRKHSLSFSIWIFCKSFQSCQEYLIDISFVLLSIICQNRIQVTSMRNQQFTLYVLPKELYDMKFVKVLFLVCTKRFSVMKCYVWGKSVNSDNINIRFSTLSSFMQHKIVHKCSHGDNCLFIPKGWKRHSSDQKIIQHHFWMLLVKNPDVTNVLI